jgi:hypothetical protein
VFTLDSPVTSFFFTDEPQPKKRRLPTRHEVLYTADDLQQLLRNKESSGTTSKSQPAQVCINIKNFNFLILEKCINMIICIIVTISGPMWCLQERYSPFKEGEG